MEHGTLEIDSTEKSVQFFIPTEYKTFKNQVTNSPLVNPHTSQLYLKKKRASHLLRDIQGFDNLLKIEGVRFFRQNSKLRTDDFFIESSYSVTGKTCTP